MQLPNESVNVVSVERRVWIVFLLNPFGDAFHVMDFRVGDAVEVESRGPAAVVMPADAVAYQFYDTVEVVFELEGVRHTYSKTPENEWDDRVNPTPWQFPDAAFVERAAVPANFAEEADVRDGERWIRTRLGTYFYFGAPQDHPVEVL